jgi:diadenosine tetraphosphate (Ap4A) HIT family hydrolase
MNKDFSELIKQLFNEQASDWEQCRLGYKNLADVKVREFHFEGYTIKIQYNPRRIASTSAKIDEQSIKERKCFLCKDNLPAGQKGLVYNNDGCHVLVNPYPIFPEHFTIASVEHKPQEIKNFFSFMLKLSRDLGKYYSVFYNGPKCGASAPDHFHFQAGTKHFLPIDNDFPMLKNKYGKLIHGDKEINLFAIDDGLRKMLSIEGSSSDKIIEQFNKIYKVLEKQSGSREEPVMNISSSFENGKWRIIIFLREKHRPHHYFEEGEKQILLSPAIVDISGLCVTPRANDFNKITKQDIEDIFREVFISKEKFVNLLNNL